MQEKGLLRMIRDATSAGVLIKSKPLSENDIERYFNDPKASLNLCRIIISGEDIPMRLYATELLTQTMNSRTVLASWKAISSQEKSEIKQGVFNALEAVRDPQGREAIAKYLGALFELDREPDDPWLAIILKFIDDKCTGNIDQANCLIGAEIFRSLTKTAPKWLSRQLSEWYELITTIMKCAETGDYLSSAAIAIILEGLAALLPQTVETTLLRRDFTRDDVLWHLTPLLIKAIQALAVNDVPHERYRRAFTFVECIAANMETHPSFIAKRNLSLYLRLCAFVSRKERLDETLHVLGLEHLTKFLRQMQKKKQLQQGDFDDVLRTVIYTLSAEDMKSFEDVERTYTAGLYRHGSVQLCAALDSFKVLLSCQSTNSSMEYLLHSLCFGGGFKQPAPLRIFYLCLIVLIENTNGSNLSESYLNEFFPHIETGIQDTKSTELHTAYLTLFVYTRQTQPMIWNFTNKIFPLLVDYLENMRRQLLSDGVIECASIQRFFYALEQHMLHAKPEFLTSYVNKMFNILFDLIHNSKCSIILRSCVLSAFGALIKVSNEKQINKHFDELITLMEKQMTARATTIADTVMRGHAMDAIATLTLRCAQKRFERLAEPILNYLICLIESNVDECYMRRAIFRLIGALTSINTLHACWPRTFAIIMNQAYASAEGIHPSVATTTTTTTTEETFEKNTSAKLMDMFCEQKATIKAIKYFALNTPEAFTPYIRRAFHSVLQSLDHSQTHVRIIACETIMELMRIQLQQSPRTPIIMEILNEMRNMIMPKLVRLISEVENSEVVTKALRCLALLLRELRKEALIDTFMTKAVFRCIKDIFKGYIGCPTDTADGLLREGARLLPLFGNAVGSNYFAFCFEKMPTILSNALIRCKGELKDERAQRTVLYETLAYCIEPLGKYAAIYNEIWSTMFRGLNDEYATVRELACFGVGELIYHASPCKLECFSNALQELQRLIKFEEHSGVRDKYCGAMARLLLSDIKRVNNLQTVVSSMIKLLPLRVHQEENAKIILALSFLFTESRYSIARHIKTMLNYTFHVLEHHEKHLDVEAYKTAKELLLCLSRNYNLEFKSFANVNPDVRDYL